MSGYLALSTITNGDRGLNNNDSSPENTGRISPSAPLHQGGLLPREELLAAVKSSDEPRLRHALEHSHPADVDHIFPHPDSSALIHIAAQNNSASIVKLLLEAGAAPNLCDQRGKKFTALHYAVQNGHHEVVQVLLRKGADANVKEGEFGRSCLHLLALKWKTAENDYRLCLDELLKQKNIKIDGKDSSGATALYLAAQKGWEYMALKLIMKSASLETKVGSKTVDALIDKNLPGLKAKIDYSAIEKMKKFYGDDLYDAMREENLDAFRGILNEINEKDKPSMASYLEEDHGKYTLLNYACDHALYEFADALLKEGADIIHYDVTTKLSPALYAAKNGYYKVMEVLTDNMKKLGLLKKGALNATDMKGETALHKVVKRELPADKEGVDYGRCLQILLNVKDYLNIDAQDEFGNTPLHYAVLCDDQSFVRHLLINGAHLGIKNAFGTLAITRIQPSVLENVLNDCVKFNNNMSDRDFEIILRYSMLAPANFGAKPETDCLKFLSGSKPHRHLLRHPVIDTFLFLKWQRIRHYYFINLAAYLAFLILLTTYIILYFGAGKVQTPTPENITDVNGNEVSSSIYDSIALKLSLQVLILFFWAYAAVRELVQLSVSWRAFVTSLENWLEIAILTMTIIVLFIKVNYVSMQGLTAWLILSTWVEFVLILGRHPYFAVYITMFTTVTFNFLKFTFMFSFMIIAFSLSFFLVFQVDDNFVSYPKTLLKTIAMSTGEMEYTELPLTDFPVASHLLFVVFVFLIVLVLMNLLNGLAVSDIQLIQQEAELVSYRSRVELISYIESVFLANPFQQTGNDKMCKSDRCCFKACTASLNPLLRFLNHLGKRTLMFQHCLKEHQITMFPNRGKNRWFVCDCHSFQLEESQIEAAKSVILEEEGRVSDRLTGLESRVDSVMNAIVQLTDMVKKNGMAAAPIE